ncbi:MAG: chemotaxis response regulator protein-glutamate methylesterase [Dehalococcoidia bacterium]|nr:chemotaxis response regulator protein-glutamate methylesterase [Dehalococcoidia bacterium]
MALPAPLPAHPVRVLVVDDSAFMRHAIERLLGKVPGIEVVGTAADGVEAVQKALELRPDVITMDVEMPRMDGVTAVGEIMQTTPTPIVMVSTMTTAGAETTLRALEAGAVDFIAKPSHLSVQITSVGDELTAAIHRARGARVTRKRPRPEGALAKTGSISSAVSSAAIAVIGCSTGGPPALTEVVPRLPADLPAGVVVVQHMPAGFTGALARRLDQLSPLHVKEAAEGDVVAAGQVLVAPGDYHTVIGRDRRVRLHQGPQLHGVRPSVDVTLDSVVEVYGSRATVAILTGMGRDGADGCARIEEAGGKVIVQDEATSVVYGMPRVAREKTRRATQLPIDRIAEAVAEGTRAATGRGR